MRQTASVRFSISFLTSLLALVGLMGCGGSSNSTSDTTQGETCERQWWEYYSYHEPGKDQYAKKCVIGEFVDYSPSTSDEECAPDKMTVEYDRPDGSIFVRTTISDWSPKYEQFDEAGNLVMMANYADDDRPRILWFYGYDSVGHQTGFWQDVVIEDGMVAGLNFESFLDLEQCLDMPGIEVDRDGLLDSCKRDIYRPAVEDPFILPEVAEPLCRTAEVTVHHLRDDGQETFVGAFYTGQSSYFWHTQYDYDSVGRQTAERRYSGDRLSEQYTRTYNPGDDRPVIEEHDQDGDGVTDFITVWLYQDRTTMSELRTADTSKLVHRSITLYDTEGRITSQESQGPTGETEYVRKISYDKIGRTVSDAHTWLQYGRFHMAETWSYDEGGLLSAYTDVEETGTGQSFDPVKTIKDYRAEYVYDSTSRMVEQRDYGAGLTEGSYVLYGVHAFKYEGDCN
jgi:hypothetical protein